MLDLSHLYNYFVVYRNNFDIDGDGIPKLVRNDEVIDSQHLARVENFSCNLSNLHMKSFSSRLVHCASSHEV